MSDLVIGPLLRHVGEHDATVWVETEQPCTVEVLGHRERTWTVGGHHYALVVVEGLSAGSTTPYDVRLDGEVVWPPAGSKLPPPRIRTLDPDHPLRVVFGSCRYATPAAVTDDKHFDADALDAYAKRMARLPDERWPDALLLLGDQVYADETSDTVRAKIRDAAGHQCRAVRAGGGLRGVHLALPRVAGATRTSAGCCRRSRPR